MIVSSESTLRPLNARLHAHANTQCNRKLKIRRGEREALVPLELPTQTLFFFITEAKRALVRLQDGKGNGFPSVNVNKQNIPVKEYFKDAVDAYFPADEGGKVLFMQNIL